MAYVAIADRDVEAHVMLSDVDRAMHSLPEEQREAIALVLVEGLSYKEAAEVMGRQAGTVRGLTFRAIASLRRRLQPGDELVR